MKKLTSFFLAGMLSVLLSAQTKSESAYGVLGKECLLPRTACSVFGYQAFSYSWPISASPYIMECGPPERTPWVGQEPLYPGGCNGQSITDANGIIINSGGWGAYINFTFTLNYGILPHFYFSTTITRTVYVDCWTYGQNC